MLSIRPLTMTPVGANGRQRPRLRAVAHHDDHQERRNAGAPRDRHRHRRQQRRRRRHCRDRATPASAASTKNIIGMSPAFPRQMRTARCAMRSRVPFSCACVNSSVTPASVRNSDDREARDDLVERHARQVDADDPGQRERQNADVQLRETADENRDDERGERYVREIHSVLSTSQRPQQHGGMDGASRP